MPGAYYFQCPVPPSVIHRVLKPGQKSEIFPRIYAKLVNKELSVVCCPPLVLLSDCHPRGRVELGTVHIELARTMGGNLKPVLIDTRPDSIYLSAHLLERAMPHCYV